MTSFNRNLAAGALTVAAALFAVVAPAQAAPASDARVRTVSTAGINLASPAGRAELEAKLARAAKSVCTPSDIRDLRQAQQTRGCIATALADSRVQIAAITARTQLASADAVPTRSH